jgi:hypothetical protein
MQFWKKREPRGTGFLKVENAGWLTGAFRHNKLSLSYFLSTPAGINGRLQHHEIVMKVTPLELSAATCVINKVHAKNGGVHSQTVNHALL